MQSVKGQWCGDEVINNLDQINSHSGDVTDETGLFLILGIKNVKTKHILESMKYHNLWSPLVSNTKVLPTSYRVSMLLMKVDTWLDALLD